MSDYFIQELAKKIAEKNGIKYIPPERIIKEDLNVNYKIVRGRFFWCGNTRSINRIRTISPLNKITDCLYVDFSNNSDDISWFTIRQDPLGYGFDFQHNTNNKKYMFFPIKDDVDRTKPFYLFSNDFTHRSKPINLLTDYYQKGDKLDCAICLDSLNLENIAILCCGHSFCEKCIDKYLEDSKLNCKMCIPGSYACGTTCEQYHHFDFIKCPVCKKLSF